MITEDYCSYEISRLLKEKGFDVPIDTYFHDGNDFVCENYVTNWNAKEEYVSRPSQSLAMKWLREVHNMYINICASGGSLGWWYHIWAIPTHENKLSHRLLRRGEDYPYLSYEDAVDAALKYCLTNLI